MKLLLENIDNLNDKDLITLCSTDLGTLGLIDITDVFNYYKNNNYTTYDILVSMVEYRYNTSYHPIIIKDRNGNDRVKEEKIIRCIRIFLAQLGDYIKNNVTDCETIKSLKELYNNIRLISILLTDECELYKNNIQQNIRDLFEYDKSNGGKILDYFNNNIINNENYNNISKSLNCILICIQHITGIRWNKEEHGILNYNSIKSMRYLHETLVNTLLELATKKSEGHEFDNFESKLYELLINFYWRRIKSHNLDNLRYIKLEYSGRSLDYLNILMEINDKIESDIVDICYLTDYEKEDFNKYKTKLIRYCLDKTM